MKPDQTQLRIKFLEKSKEKLAERRAEVVAALEEELRKVRNEIIVARALRKEQPKLESDLEKALQGENQARREEAAKILKTLQIKEAEKVKELVQEAILHNEKGKRARQLMAELSDLETKIARVAQELDYYRTKKR